MALVDLQALCDGSIVHRALHMTIVSTDSGVHLTARTGSDHLGSADSDLVHGGVIATLLDTAATFALIAHTETDWVTVDLRVDYLRPVRVGHTSITGTVRRAGRSLGRAESALSDASGRVCATAVGTFAPGATGTTSPTAGRPADDIG